MTRHANSKGITINNLRADLPPVTTDSWWLDRSPADFYAIVRQRQPILAARYGSAPISIAGPIDVGFNERARRVKQAERERIQRLAS